MKDAYFDTIVLGGGASGFFSAIHASANGGNTLIIEKTNKFLSKVKISGGGRCNVTHDENRLSELIKFYPRGSKSLKKSFGQFGVKDTIDWFERRGVQLKTESDGRIFPVSNSSQSIIDVLMRECKKSNISLLSSTRINTINLIESGFQIFSEENESFRCKNLIVAIGGNANLRHYSIFEKLKISFIDPIPSLFTFNIPDSGIKDLMGISVNNGIVQIPGSKWKNQGPILITHWGLSAPSIIGLSSYAAIDLHEREYQFPILVNWTGRKEDEVREVINDYKKSHPNKSVLNNSLLDIPSRLWKRLCIFSEIDNEDKYGELPKRKLNKLIELLVRSDFNVSGKTTFKEEFVTCGGVELSEIDLKSFESRKIPNLYIIGEALNVDALTGGYNFQHAWTSGYLAGMSISNK